MNTFDIKEYEFLLIKLRRIFDEICLVISVLSESDQDKVSALLRNRLIRHIR